MIQITTVRPDATGFNDHQNVAPGVTFSAKTGTIIVTDGEQAFEVKITAEVEAEYHPGDNYDIKEAIALACSTIKKNKKITTK